MSALKRSTPLLRCIPCADHTRHVFDELRPAVPIAKSTIPGGDKPGVAVMYKCGNCGALRVWGFESAPA